MKGFTLIELLVVVLIIGILSAVALPQYQTAVAKSRFSQLLVSGRAIMTAENVYYMANGEYASNFEDLDFGPQGELNAEGTVVTFGKAQCVIGANDNKEWYCLYPGDAKIPILIRAYMNDKMFYCRVRGENKAAEKVCSAMGGYDKNCGSGYCQWKLP